MPRGRKNHLNIAIVFAFCRQRESNPGRQCSKEARYPLHHCPSAATSFLELSHNRSILSLFSRVEKMKNVVQAVTELPIEISDTVRI